MTGQLTFNEWKERYKPTTTKVIQVHEKDEAGFKIVCDLAPNNIWRLISTDIDVTFITNDLSSPYPACPEVFHGYFITKVPYTPGQLVAASWYQNE